MIAIVALLAVGTIPAFNAIAGSHGVTRGAYDVAGLLELARSEAVARQTYVWVGVASTNVSGNTELIAGAVYSRDGSGTNTSAANLGSLSKVLRVRDAKLSKWADLKPETRALLTNAPTASLAATNSAAVSFSIGKAGFQSHSITFTPRGEATLKGSVGPDDGFDSSIDVSFCQARGDTVPAEADDAAVLVEGATGMSKILRIQ